MSIGILGKKLGMSQFFDDKGRSIPVTLVEAGPCRITQIKNSAVDGFAISLKDILNNEKQRFDIIGMAKAGHPFLNKVSKVIDLFFILLNKNTIKFLSSKLKSIVSRFVILKV